MELFARNPNTTKFEVVFRQVLPNVWEQGVYVSFSRWFVVVVVVVVVVVAVVVVVGVVLLFVRSCVGGTFYGGLGWGGVGVG